MIIVGHCKSRLGQLKIPVALAPDLNLIAVLSPSASLTWVLRVSEWDRVLISVHPSPQRVVGEAMIVMEKVELEIKSSHSGTRLSASV